MDKRSFRYILLIITISIVIVFSLWNINSIFLYLSKTMMIFRPIIIGFAISFILYKPLTGLKKLYMKLFKSKKAEKAADALALISVYLILFLFITALILIIIPQFAKSIISFKDNMTDYIDNFKKMTNDVFQKVNATVPANVDISEKLTSYLEKIPEISGKGIKGAFGFTTSLIGTLVDIFFGLIISVYFLTSRKKLKLQAKKVLYASFSEDKANKIIDFAAYIAQVFLNFITGQLIEACILGILCFIGMNIFGFEYAVLISTLVAVTNVIPIVGPLIGTIPSFLIILLVNPTMALWFLVFIIILQQIECNLIYPRVVGTQVGLPALWVLLAVLVGGGLFGVIGMLFAVPTMSIIYDLTRKNVKCKLDKKNLNIS